MVPINLYLLPIIKEDADEGDADLTGIGVLDEVFRVFLVEIILYMKTVTMMIRLMTAAVSGKISDTLCSSRSSSRRSVLGRWNTTLPCTLASLILSTLTGPYPMMLWRQDSGHKLF